MTFFFDFLMTKGILNFLIQDWHIVGTIQTFTALFHTQTYTHTETPKDKTQIGLSQVKQPLLSRMLSFSYPTVKLSLKGIAII